MSSEIPKKSSGNGNNVFIAMTVVMLLASGGLIWWKFAGASASDSGASTPTIPSVEDRLRDESLPPPPPPPPEEPSASATVATPANAPVRSGKSPCPSTCEGEASGALQSALAGRGAAGRRCYEKSLAQNPLLKGRMTVHVKVGTNGSVCAANVSRDELHDPGLTNCIMGVFRSSTRAVPQSK
jgi:hypothetical protein